MLMCFAGTTFSVAWSRKSVSTELKLFCNGRWPASVGGGDFRTCGHMPVGGVLMGFLQVG